MAAPAIAARALPYAAKIPAALKAIYGSKHFWNILMATGIFGSGALGEVSKAGERKLARAQMEAETGFGKLSAEAAKKATRESRERTREYTERLLKERREERREMRELAAMQTFSESQDRQMALIMQAVAGLSNRNLGAATGSPGGGMLGLMRGNF